MVPTSEYLAKSNVLAQLFGERAKQHLIHDLAARNLGLSFCPGATALPN